MKSCLVLVSIAASALLFAAPAWSVTHSIHSYDANHHGVWIPGLDQRHLHFDDGSTITLEPDAWRIDGTLTSATDGSRWTIGVDFTGVLTGDEFGVLTGFDDARVKGTTWANQRDDWAFAETVSGTLVALDGAHAGEQYSIERMGGGNDYWAQLGTCLNDKNCDPGLSTWIVFRNAKSGETHRGDINARIGAPVPEPSAALVFGVGTLVAGAALRRRGR